MSRKNRPDAASFTGRAKSHETEVLDPLALAQQRDEAAAAEAAKPEEAAAPAVVEDEGALGAPAADLPAGLPGDDKVDRPDPGATKLVVEVAGIAEGDVVNVQRVALEPSTQVEASERAAAIPEPTLAVPEVKTTLPPAPALVQPKVEEPTSPPSYQSRVATHSAMKAKRAESPEVIVANFQPSAEFTGLVNNELARGTPTAIRLINFLNQYVVDMAPRRPRTPEQIRKAQEGLYLKLYELVETAPVLEFDRLWRIAIMYFREYRNHCFSPLYAMRGGQEWSRSPEQFNLFTRLMNVLMACASDHARDVTIPADAQTGLSIEALGRLRNFIDNARLKELKTSKP